MASEVQTERYRAYLRRFGIEPGADRIVTLREFELGEVRFFALLDGSRLLLRAGMTSTGLISASMEPGEDWLGLLSASADAQAVAERLAWLRTETATEHELVRDAVRVLRPTEPAPGVDPAAWALVHAPTLSTDGKGVILRAWIASASHESPQCWIVSAHRDGTSSLLVQDADELLSQTPDGSRESRLARAHRVLGEHRDIALRWALDHVRKSADMTATSAVGAVLMSREVSADLRQLAAATLGSLGRLGEPTAVRVLDAALQADPASEVRRAAAQALGTLGGDTALSALVTARKQSDVRVRAEIVHALAVLGGPAQQALRTIAREDSDASIRELAAGYANAAFMPQP